jgi:hypothetical protein
MRMESKCVSYLLTMGHVTSSLANPGIFGAFQCLVFIEFAKPLISVFHYFEFVGGYGCNRWLSDIIPAKEFVNLTP